jgi:hypothetical protein
MFIIWQYILPYLIPLRSALPCNYDGRRAHRFAPTAVSRYCTIFVTLICHTDETNLDQCRKLTHHYHQHYWYYRYHLHYQFKLFAKS